MAATPVTILLARGNISDSLLVLLLVLAADAATSAFLSGRLRTLLLSGVWVGLAFQAKMLQAWIVVPALFGRLPPRRPRHRLGPPHRPRPPGRSRRRGRLPQLRQPRLPRPRPRPPVRRRQLQRLGLQPGLRLQRSRPPLGPLARSARAAPLPRPRSRSAQTTTGGATTVALGKGPGRFLDGPFGRDAAWFFPPALIALVGDPGGPAQEARDGPVAGRRPAVGRLDGLHVGLLRVLALPERLLPGRAGAAARRALRPGRRPGLATPVEPRRARCC